MTTLAALRDAIGALEHRLSDAADAVEAQLATVAPGYQISARNFAHYVGLRQHDLRALQLGLLGHGLSSLGRLEGHVVDAVAQGPAPARTAVISATSPGLVAGQGFDLPQCAPYHRRWTHDRTRQRRRRPER